MKEYIKKILKKSLMGMFISVFILHVILIIQSLDQQSLNLVLNNRFKWSELTIYLYQFAITCWTGFMIPICFELFDDHGSKLHLKLFANVLVTFSIYFSWITFNMGLPTSPWGILAIFVIFLVADYWVLYGLQYVAMKRKVDLMNLKIKSQDGTFIREGNQFNEYKRYPQ